ncbi:MAG: L,D-transpeptidase family protein [Desulfovibrionaceae bacterium]
MWRIAGRPLPWLFSIFLILCAGSAQADNWQARLYDTALPTRVVAVDKANQQFHLFEKKSPLNLKYSFACTTGQAVGDKLVMNDLRTPEGVYFVEYKIANGLDFKEYGGIAYTLNYPNPVDKLRGKTGHGIWIHSKGFGIVPRDTRGCVAIGLEEIAEVGPLLTPGTAVLLAENVPASEQPKRDSGTAHVLAQKMEQWTRAWATRSSRMFEMYDEGAYTKAMPESFAAFKANKERLFRLLPWINIFNREVYALEGPGYWVTWSEQFYRAPNLSTEGIRRLYWQQGNDGKFRIVGMEWTPRNLGMQADFLKGHLVASSERTRSDASSEAPVLPPLSMPEKPEENPPLVPPAQDAPLPASTVPLAPSIQVAQATPPVVQEMPAPSMPADGPAEVPAPPASVPPPPPVLTLDTATSALLSAKMTQWAQAWQARSASFFDFYDSATYGNATVLKAAGMPQRRNDNFRSLKSDMERRFRSSPWIHIISRPVKVSTEGTLARTTCAQFIRIPGQKPVQGERSLYWQKGADGQFRIVASTWQDQALGMEAEYLEAVSPQISQFVAHWGAVWLTGDAKAYGAFYSPKAKQQGRWGQSAIVSHKARIWAKTAPAVVQLSGLRLIMDTRGIRVDMTQIYRDSNNFEDKGTKTLLLEPLGTTWSIVEEDWAPLTTPATPPAPAGQG